MRKDFDENSTSRKIRGLSKIKTEKKKLKLSSLNIVILSFFPLNGEMEFFLLKFSFYSTRFSQ